MGWMNESFQPYGGGPKGSRAGDEAIGLTWPDLQNHPEGQSYEGVAIIKGRIGSGVRVLGRKFVCGSNFDTVEQAAKMRDK